jgi:hypothetical protein
MSGVTSQSYNNKKEKGVIFLHPTTGMLLSKVIIQTGYVGRHYRYLQQWVNVSLSLCTPWKHMGRVLVQIHLFLTSAPHKSEALHVPFLLHPWKNLGTNEIGSWMGPREGLDVLDKRKYISFACIRASDCPARSGSLYRLQYPEFIQWHSLRFDLTSMCKIVTFCCV